MIKTFADSETETVFRREFCRSLPLDIQRRAQRKLYMLHEAVSLQDVRAVPGNRLDLLQGDRAGQHSIRINQQWRITFVWADGDAYHVKIEDYH
jgi:proteic killer suppression protein